MQLELKSWGHSVGIIIPKAILLSAGLNLGDKLNVKTENSSIILEKTFRHKTLEERIKESGTLLELSGEMDFGEAKGREIW